MEEDLSKKIINESETVIRGISYKETLFADNHTELKTYDKKIKMWITLKFKPSDEGDDKIIANVIETARRVL